MTVTRRSRYLDAFIASSCAPALLMYGMFPNAKEITESWAMFAATGRLGPRFDWNAPDVTVACVGDGKTPRTAAMFAFRSRWLAHSIDPELEPKPYDIERLEQHRARVSEVSIQHDGPVVIIAGHSHAPLEDALDSIHGSPRAVIAMPCCLPQEVPGCEPDLVFEDPYVWSPKNEVRVWCSV